MVPGGARLWQRRQRIYRTDRGGAPPAVQHVAHKYYVDEGYDYVFTGRRKLGNVRLGRWEPGEGSSWFDAHVVDGAVNAAGWFTRLTCDVFQLVGQVDHRRHRRERACDSGAHVAVIRRGLFEWGLVQWYALVMTAGLVGFVFYYVYH